MSSEEEARAKLEDIVMRLAGTLGTVEGSIVCFALDTYRTAIERRVLAQQPCYCAEALATETRCAFHGSLCPCVTCKARQTQETSG